MEEYALVCKKHSLRFQPINIVEIYRGLKSIIKSEYWRIKYKVIPNLRLNLMHMSPLSRKIRFFIGHWSKDPLYVDRKGLDGYYKESKVKNE